jgi:hypothetical protein
MRKAIESLSETTYDFLYEIFRAGYKLFYNFERWYYCQKY